MSLILLDIGGSYIKCADGRNIPVPSQGSREEICTALREAVGLQGQAWVEGIGVAIPGPFDFGQGIFLMKHKYAAVYGERFASLAGIPEGIPVRYMHDVNAPLAGAIRMMGLKDAALVTLGTGLGFSYALDGKVQENEAGSPALSLWKEPWNGGILEEWVSARAVSGTYTRLSGLPCSSARDVSLKAAAGDPHALEAYARVGETLGQALSPILQQLGIRTLLMGGQVSRSLPLMESPLRKSLPEIGIIPLPGQAVFEGLSSLFT